MQNTGYEELQPLAIVDDRFGDEKLADGDWREDADHKMENGVPMARRTKGDKEWWVIDTRDAEKARQSVLKHYHKTREAQLEREQQHRLTEDERKFFFKELKSRMNEEYHEQLARDRIYWLDEAERRGDIWTTTDASAFLSSYMHKYISSTRVRMWAVRGWVAYDRDGERGWYIFRAEYLIELMKKLRVELTDEPEILLDQMLKIHAQKLATSGEYV